MDTMTLSRWRAARVAVALLLVICLAVSSCAFSRDAAPQPAPVTVSAMINLSAIARAEAIPSSFAGFSIESKSLCGLLELERNDPSVDQFYRNLSPMIVRIGGTSGDMMRWVPEAECTDQTLGLSAVADLFSFAQRIHARVIWGLNLRANDPRAASDEANAVRLAAGGQLQGIEMGNEPNNWTTQSDYEQAWSAYVSAIRANNASGNPIPFVGPAMYDNGGRNWFAATVKDEHGFLSLVTYHYYPLRKQMIAGDTAQAAIGDLLSASLMSQTATDLDRVAAIARTQGLGIEIDETNSVNDGGASGVSDRFASALWAADYLFTAAEHGVLAVDFHGNGGASDGPSYSPLVTNPATHQLTAQPLYYGMLFFHLAAGDGRSVPLGATISTPANLAVHAIINSSGVTRVALINKDPSKTVQARVTLPAGGPAYQNGVVIRLLAPSLSARDGVTLGGAAVADSGAWSATARETTPVTGASFSLTVPAGSAALVILAPQQ